MGLDFNRLCANYSGANNGYGTFMVLSIVAFGLLGFSIYTGVAAEGSAMGALKGGRHSSLLAFGSLCMLFIVGCIGWNSANRCTEFKKSEHITKIRGFGQFFVAITTLSLGGMGILFTRMHCQGGIGQGLMGKLEGAAKSATGGLIPGL